MHASQGFGYPLPDLDSPMFVSKLVLEDDGEQESEFEDGSDCPCSANDRAQGREETNVNSLHENSARAPDSRVSSARAGSSYAKCSRGTSPGVSSPRVTMAILQRLTAETYLLHDPAAGTPRQRWQHFLALHDAARRDSAVRGLDDVQAFLPPRIERAFGRRLERLGWRRDPWPCFTLRI